MNTPGPARALTRVRRAITRVAGMVIALAGGYAAVCLVACSVQDSIMFPRAIANEGAAPASPPTSASLEVHWLEVGGGERVEAWFLPAKERGASRPAPAVMFFHGNGSLIDYSLDIAEVWRGLGVSVLLAEYRGYGRSGGSPSERGIVSDMERWREWLDAREEVDASRVVYHGQSLGGGVAGALSVRRPPAALVLHSTFTSMEAMVSMYGLPGFVARHPFRTDRALLGFDGPVLILHGLQDSVIPAHHSASLARSARRATLVTGAGGHNDYPPTTAELAETLRAFLDESKLLSARGS